MWTKDGEKDLSAGRYIPRDLLTGLITHVRKTAGKYLQVLAPQTHSGTTSATTSTWCILASIPVTVYLSVFTFREKAYIAK
jgi:hypothetical protein